MMLVIVCIVLCFLGGTRSDIIANETKTVDRMQKDNECNVDVITSTLKKIQMELTNHKKMIVAQAEEIHQLKLQKINSKRLGPEIRVAFTAYLDHALDVTHGNIILLNQVLHNQGNAYNHLTGILSVPISGTYLLAFEIEDWREKEDTVIDMVVDGQLLVGAVIYPAGMSVHGGNSAVVHLNAGQSVWLKVSSANAHLNGGSVRGTTFTGVLLY